MRHSLLLQHRLRNQVLFANQAVYNLIITAGLGWALRTGDVAWQEFFLGAVVAVGVFGTFSAMFVIFYAQASGHMTVYS